MKRVVFAILWMIDAVEAIPYNIRFAVEVSWWAISLPFALLRIKVIHQINLRRIDKGLPCLRYSREEQ